MRLKEVEHALHAKVTHPKEVRVHRVDLVAKRDEGKKG